MTEYNPIKTPEPLLEPDETKCIIIITKEDIVEAIKEAIDERVYTTYRRRGKGGKAWGEK